MQAEVDLFIIGAGSAGVRAARMAAATKARVAIAEESRVGGTCVIRGCIPKKLFSYAAHFHEDFEDARGFGWDIQGIRFDWPTLISNKDKEIDRLNGIYKKLLLESGVELIENSARLHSPDEVEVGGRIIKAKHILIATGGWPAKPNIPGIEHAITSNEAFHLPSLPKRILIVGGGYIAVEFAGIFNGLGSHVTQLYRGEQILRGFDNDIRDFLHQEMEKKGISIRLGTDAVKIEKKKELEVSLNDGTTLNCDAIMYATGRKPKTEVLGLEGCGIKVDDIGAIRVDEYSQTTHKNIYAIGDCTNRLNLTPVAIREAMCFVDTVYNNRPSKMDYENIASAVFSHPPIGTIGLSEEEARKNAEVQIYKTSFRPLKHTLSGRDERTMMKLIVDRKTRIIVGAHMVGADAPEIIQTLAIAVKMRATKEDFDRTVAIHPTSAEEFVTLRSSLA